MTKLSKTAQALIAETKARGRRVVGVERGSGLGAGAGKVKYGDRRFNAGLELVRKGYARQIGEIVRSRHTRNGYTVHHSDLTVELLEGV